MTEYAGKIEGKGEHLSILLVQVKMTTVTMQINVEDPQKSENRSTTRPSYTVLGHIPKGLTEEIFAHL